MGVKESDSVTWGFIYNQIQREYAKPREGKGPTDFKRVDQLRQRLRAVAYKGQQKQMEKAAA